MSLGLIGLFIIYTLLVVYWGPMIRLDNALNRNFHVQPLWPVLSRIDRIGQASPLNWSPDRTICLPLLGVIAAVTGWRRRSWRPLGLAVLTVAFNNLLVTIPKFTLDRGRPLSGHSFFSNGDLYPSGHTANMVAFYGLCYYLMTRYGDVSLRTKRWLFRIVVALSVVMFLTSLLLRWHWFSDLIGGFMLGGAVLALVIGIDGMLPSRTHPPSGSPGPSRPETVEIEPRPVMAHTDQSLVRGYPLSASTDVDDRSSGS